jgi:hypothetical protein
MVASGRVKESRKIATKVVSDRKRTISVSLLFITKVNLSFLIYFYFLSGRIYTLYTVYTLCAKVCYNKPALKGGQSYPV